MRGLPIEQRDAEFQLYLTQIELSRTVLENQLSLPLAVGHASRRIPDSDVIELEL